MNKYVRVAFCVPCTLIKIGINKLKCGSNFHMHFSSVMSIMSELTIEKGSIVNIGKRFTMRGGARLRVRNGTLIVGDRTYVNHNCIITCHERIEIGDNVQLSPNVQIYDHDHDYQSGLSNQEFKCAPIKIGNEVWIGTNSVILRGSIIGNNAVIGAGSIVKGYIPAGAVFVQKRDNTILLS